jgi:hypothetical protein
VQRTTWCCAAPGREAHQPGSSFTRRPCAPPRRYPGRHGGPASR